MVTANLLGVGIMLLKTVAILLGFAAGVVLLVILLPVKARVEGSLAADRLLEEVADNEARLVFKVAGSGPAPVGPEDGSEDGIVPVAIRYDLALTVLAGAVGIEFAGGGPPKIVVAGMGFEPGRRSRRATAPPGVRGKASCREKDRDAKERSEDRQAKRAKRPRSGRQGISLAEIRKYLSPGIKEKAIGAFASLGKALHLHGSLDVECGFPDCGYTGMAYAAYAALSGMGAIRGLSFRPNFQEETLKAEFSGGMWMVPVRVGFIAGAFMLSPEIRPLWRKRKRPRAGDESTRKPAGKPVMQ